MAPNLFCHPVLNSKRDLVGSDALQHNHLLENAELFVPLSWQRQVLRSSRVKELLELLVVLKEGFVDSLKGWKLAHSVDLLVDFSPLKLSKPVSWVRRNINSS